MRYIQQLHRGTNVRTREVPALSRDTEELHSVLSAVDHAQRLRDDLVALRDRVVRYAISPEEARAQLEQVLNDNDICQVADRIELLRDGAVKQLQDLKGVARDELAYVRSLPGTTPES